MIKMTVNDVIIQLYDFVNRYANGTIMIDGKSINIEDLPVAKIEIFDGKVKVFHELNID